MNAFSKQNRILNKPFYNILIIFSLVTVLLTFAGFYYYNSQKNEIINSRFDYLGSIADYKLSQIEQWLNEKFNDLELLKISSPLTKINGNKIIRSGKISPEIVTWFSKLKKYYNYDNILISDYNGNLLYSMKTGVDSISSIDSSLGKTAIDSNIVLFSDTDIQTATQGELKFYVPIDEQPPDRKNKFALILALEPRKNFEQILNTYIDKSPTMESLLIKSHGDSVLYLNKLRFGIRENALSFSSDNRALVQTSTIKDRRGFVEGIDYKNDEVVADIQKVPGTAWFLITKINKWEFYEPADNLAKLVFLVVTSADLLFAIVLFFVWRKNIVSNYLKLYETETEKNKVEKRFESLVNGVKDIAIYLFDTEGRIISWNKGSEKINGYTSQEILGKHFSIFYPKDERAQNKPEFDLNSAILAGSAQDEGWRIKKDGSAFWASSLITALKDEEGKVYGFLEITHDLTKQRNNEEEIKKSRDFYLKLLDDFPNPVWRSDLDGKLNYFNKAWLKFTGKTLEQEKDEGWMSNIHPEDKDKMIKEYQSAYHFQRGFIIEYRLKDIHGEYRWIINFGMPYYDIEQKFSGFLGSCYDINDRRKYEDTINTLLRISEKLYSSLEIDQILDGLVLESINLTDANSGFACILNEKNFTTRRYFHKDHWEYLDKIYSYDHYLIHRMNTTKESVFYENRGERTVLSPELDVKYDIKYVLSTPLFGTNGELIGFFEIHNKNNNKMFSMDDVNLLRAVAKNASISISKSLNYEKLRKTEAQLRNSEAELRNLAAQIQYAREAERQLIAREVHDELGQLFTGINLNISLLTELLEQNKKLSVSEIIDELNSVQGFVNKGIQTVRNISGSLRSYVLDHLGLVPAVHEYCREIERISSIKCNFYSEIETVNMDDEKNVALFRIIQEALTNAIRHADASVIDVKIEQFEGNLNISISDNGNGMAQSPESITGSIGILGMKERAIFLGGTLNIESESGKGTKILLIMPLEKFQLEKD